VANEGLKAIYDKVFRKVKANPQVQGLERGLLYKVVQIILGEEQSQSQGKTREICGELNIKPSSNRDDDYKVIEDLIKTAFIDRQVITKFIPGKDVVSDLSMKFNLSYKNEEEKMEWVVIAACILVGVYFCLQYLRDTQQKKASQEQKTESTKPLPLSPIPAALCLVVPAKVVSGLQVNTSLSSIDVEDFITNASYFLSTPPEIANSNEQKLNLTDEYISSESQRDVYLRIDTNDGRDIIDKKILYGLKSNLSPNAQFFVKQVACLKSLSGLEVFNRV
jgi:hypothetical protein